MAGPVGWWIDGAALCAGPLQTGAPRALRPAAKQRTTVSSGLRHAGKRFKTASLAGSGDNGHENRIRQARGRVAVLDKPQHVGYGFSLPGYMHVDNAIRRIISMAKHKKHERKKELDRRRKRRKERLKERIREAKAAK